MMQPLEAVIPILQAAGEQIPGGEVCLPWWLVSAVGGSMAAAIVAQWRASGQQARRMEERLDQILRERKAS